MARYSMCVYINILAAAIEAEPCPGMSAAKQASREDLGRKHVGRVSWKLGENSCSSAFLPEPSSGIC